MNKSLADIKYYVEESAHELIKSRGTTPEIYMRNNPGGTPEIREEMHYGEDDIEFKYWNQHNGLPCEFSASPRFVNEGALELIARERGWFGRKVVPSPRVGFMPQPQTNSDE